MEQSKITHYRDSVIVMPKQKKAVIKRQFYRKTTTAKFKRLKREWEFIKKWDLKNDIPKEEYTTVQHFFDNTAFNNDDREYSIDVVKKRYSLDKIKEIENFIINKYNITKDIVQIIN